MSQDRHRVVSLSPRRNMNRWMQVVAHALDEQELGLPAEVRRAVVAEAARYAEECGYVLTAQTGRGR